MLDRPEAVRVIVAPAHAPAGVVLRLPMVGQTSQPPGPIKAYCAVAVQLLASVTVTEYVPTIKPL